MRSLFLCALCLSALAAQAQADGQWMPAPMPTRAPLPGPSVPLPTDPIKLGIQFHGELLGSASGAGVTSLGLTASVGLGLNRVAFLLTPTVMLAGSLSAISLALSVRIYFKTREQGALVGFLRPSALVGTAGSFGGFGALYGGLGLGGGGEYLVTRNLGITAELGLTFNSFGASGGPQGGGSVSVATLTTVAAVGVMLHQ